MSIEPAPAAEEGEVAQKPQPPKKHREQDEKRHSRLDLTLREAEIIARNLKESGTRR